MTLIQLAQQLLSEGKLPHLDGCMTYWGPGKGNTCSICGYLISRETLEIGVRCEEGIADAKFCVHVECYAAWAMAIGEQASTRPAP